MLRNTYLNPYWQGVVRLYFIVRTENAIRAFEWNRTLSNLFRLISLFGSMTLTTIIAIQSTNHANSDSVRRFWFFVSSLVLSSIIGIGNELNHNFHFGERAKLWSRYISDVRTLGMNFFGLCGKFRNTTWEESVHDFVRELAYLEKQLTRDIESLGSNQSSGSSRGGFPDVAAEADGGAGKKADSGSEPIIITSGEPPRGLGKDPLGSADKSSLGRSMTRSDTLHDFSLLASATMRTPPNLAPIIESTAGKDGAKAIEAIIAELPSPKSGDSSSTDSNNRATSDEP